MHLGLLFLADERLGPKSFGVVLPNWNPFVRLASFCQFLVGIAGEDDVDTPAARALWLNTRPLASISEIRPSNDPAEQLASPTPKN